MLQCDNVPCPQGSHHASGQKLATPCHCFPRNYLVLVGRRVIFGCGVSITCSSFSGSLGGGGGEKGDSYVRSCSFLVGVHAGAVSI